MNLNFALFNLNVALPWWAYILIIASPFILSAIISLVVYFINRYF
jgi:hypothetical protein